MRPPLLAPLLGLRFLAIALLAFGWTAVASAAASQKPANLVDLGHDTYQLSLSSKFLYAPGTKKLARRVRADAEQYCRDQGRQMKEVSIEEKRGDIVFGDFAKVTLTFQALPPGDPQLAAPDSATAAAPATDLAKLEELHRAGVLPAADYDAAKRRAAARSLDELHANGVLTDAEYTAAKQRLDPAVK